MEDLQLSPALLPVMQHMGELQACACCLLRAAGVRRPQAYAAAAALDSAGLLRQLEAGCLPADGAASSRPPAAAQPTDGAAGGGGPPAAAAPSGCSKASQQAGHKRRREECTEPGERSEEQAANMAGEPADVAAGAALAASGQAGPAAPPAPPPARGEALCPLCFGLLPALAGAPRSGSVRSSGSCSAAPVALQVVLAPPAWEPPSVEQFLASQGLPRPPATSNGGSADAAQLARGELEAASAEQPQDASQEPPSQSGLEQQQGQQQQQRQRPESKVLPCGGLAEAARVLATEFELVGSAGPQAGHSRDTLAGPAAAAAAGAGAGAEAGQLPPREPPDGFALELSLPASLAVRAQALWWRLLGALGKDALAAAGLAKPGKIVDLKEALRVCIGDTLSKALGQPLSPQGSLCIRLAVSHPASAAEAAWLAPAAPAAQQRKRGGRGWWAGKKGGRGGRGSEQQRQEQQQQQQRGGEEGQGSAAQQGEDEGAPTAVEVAASEGLIRRLEGMPEAEFVKVCPATAAQLDPPAAPAAGAAGSAGSGGAAAVAAAGAVVQVGGQRRSIYIGARYLKLRRGIPQSPWFIGNERKGEGSVEEAASCVVMPLLRADSCTFISAGREDIDVRMLGSGRPFALEVRNARALPPSPQQLADMQRAINAAGSGVEVRGLSVLTPQQVAQLKEAAEEKEKSYAALCWLPRPLSEADVALLEQTRDLLVQQRTPVRVLHRRANLKRPRTIHSLRAERLPGQDQYFVLHLRTQAGTYVKEFVHGDMGRTRPCLGDLLGCRAQIAYLDVTDIHMGDFLLEGAQPAAGEPF